MQESYRGELGGHPGLPLPGVARAPIVMWALLTVNIVVWWVVSPPGGSASTEVLLDFGAMFGPLIAEGEYWRLLTAMFLHVGPAHLVFNGLALFVFGRLVERAYGHLRFLIIYILAGLAGSVASYLLNSIAVGAGASGAIFGVLGALVAYIMVQRDLLGKMGQGLLTVVLFLAAMNLLYGLATPGIDNWAHAGGLAGGFALGLGLAPRYRPVRSPADGEASLADANPLTRSIWVLPVAGVLLVIGARLGTATLPDNPFSHIYRAERYFEEQNYGQALDETNVAVNMDFTAAEAYLLRGRLFSELGDSARARRELGQAIKWGDRDTRAEAIRLLLVLRSSR